MRSLMCLYLSTVPVLVIATSFAAAQFAPSVPSSPEIVLPAPSPALEITPPPIAPVRPVTVSEFVAAFKPLPGKYEVMMIHPKTGCPVKVCFTLPPGCLRTVRCTGHKIVFDYKGQCDVVIRFLHGGKVWVRG